MTSIAKHKPIGAGKSSFELIDTAKFFHALNLRKGNVFLDVACGKGSYALKAAELVGPQGTVYAIDLWEDGIAGLKTAIEAAELPNVKAIWGDASRHIPIDNQSADVALLATVLHDFVEDQTVDGVLQEIVRVTKSDATLAIMEFKKIDGPPGPPKNIRLTPAEADRLLAAYGFRQERLIDVGPYNYLLMLRKVS
ncbi:MAG: methyltransferase domain-containing protein [Desulfobacterales bacterium]|nr:MAG: methyltransferase domain-containing protein [Desulfobacterales bacterium]